MKANYSTVGCALALGLAMTMASVPVARGQTQIEAFSVPAVGAGNEGSGEHPIGNDFRVQRPITVTQLGMFDSGGDGVVGSAVIRIELWESSPESKGSSLLESMTFDAGNPGKLVGGMRYKTLPRPVTLLPGHYTLTASGFDEQNPEYNGARRSPAPAQVAVNDGGGLIRFLGVHHRNDLTLRAPQLKNMGPPERFAAGSFVYAPAPAPANAFAADYGALINGVKSFPVDSGKSNLYGSKIVLNRYGSIALMEESAFPVIMEPSGNRLILEAAGVYKGDKNGARAVVFAHEQFGHALNDGRMALFENAIKWASRKSNPSDITIALSTNLPAAYFQSRGYHVRMVDRNMKTNDFNPMPGADVLVVDFHGPYTERFMARAAEFVAGGGGLVATFLPWRYVHREIEPMFGRVNGLIKPFGLAYRSSLVTPVDYGFTSVQPEAYWPGVFNAFEAARMLRRQREGQAQLGSLEKAIALNTVAYAADRQPEMLSALTEVYSGTASGSESGGAEGAGNFVEVARLNGAATDENLSPAWSVEGTDLLAVGVRGVVEYSFTADEAGVYRVQIYGSQNLPESAWTNFNLLMRVDNVSLGEQRLTAGNRAPGQVSVLTPYLLGGSHKVKILWDNASSRTQLRLQGLRVQRATGADTDGDGINNWVEQRVARQSGLDQTNLAINSYTSPLCLEGRDPYLDVMRADVSGANVSTPRLKPEHAPNGRWFINVPLALSGDTGFRVSYQNGARSEVRRLKWVPVNVLDGGQFTVRKNDKFALVARPAGAAAGEMQLTVGTNQYPRRKVTSPQEYEFSEAGTLTIGGTYTAANGVTQSGTITVKVVEHKFGSSPACWVGGEREWDVEMPAEATLESDNRLFFETIGRLAAGGWRTTLMADENQDRYIVSRLGSHGPILDAGVARGFEFWSGQQTYLRVVETYEDASQLVELLLVMSPVLPDVSVRVNLIVGGVLFEDGTITRELKAGAFDELGRCPVRFIRPASAKTSVCHSIKVYQGAEVIGYVR